jgi:flavin-dependent dehydrogenase
MNRRSSAPDELLAFKAHFGSAALPEGLMPLLAFPGGYGGMVHCDGGQVSLSCCIRRDQLARIRQRHQGDAGEAVFAHIAESCLGVQAALGSAQRLGPWLAAGPIRPGVRVDSTGGLFRVGNAAGEAHPVIAEGISMALQSSWLLTERLLAWKSVGSHPDGLKRVQQDYAVLWRRNFVSRIRVSSAIAHWAMRPATVSMSLPLVWCFPNVLTWGARASGKANKIVRH